MRIVAITLAFCTAPVVVLLVWIGTRSHGELDRIRDALGERSVLALIGVGTVALVVAAVSISGPIERLSRQPGRLHAATVVAGANKLTEVLRRAHQSSQG